MPNREIVTKELANLFRVLSHPHRIQILEELRDGEHDVNELEEVLGVSHSRVSQQLSLLRAHKLVKMRREGRHVFYSLTQPLIADWILDSLEFITERFQISELQHAVDEVRHLWQHNPEKEQVRNGTEESPTEEK